MVSERLEIRKYLFIFCIFLLIILPIFSMPCLGFISMNFNQAYGISNSNIANSVIQDKNGSYVLVGSTALSKTDCSDIWILKVNAQGNAIWNKTLGGALNDGATDIIETRDGGYAVIGYTDVISTGDDAWLIKLDADGNIQWNKTYGGTGLDAINCIIQTDDGYAICGFTESFGRTGHDAWILKIDLEGNIQWTQTYGVSHYNEANAVIETMDNGYALAGRTQSEFSGLSFWLIKTDSTGNLQWDKTFGARENDLAKSVFQTNDGGYAVIGRRESLNFGNCSWLIKVDCSGDEQWNQTFGDFDGVTKLTDVIKTNDGNYALTGYSINSHTDSSWLLKVDLNGTIQWYESYGELGDNRALSVFQGSNGEYVLAGYTNALTNFNDFWLVLTDKKDEPISQNPVLPSQNQPSGGNNYASLLSAISFSIIFLFGFIFVIIFVKKFKTSKEQSRKSEKYL